MIEFQDAELSPNTHLCVAFTGVHGGMGGVPFEFHRSLGRAGAASLFVRDTGRSWYQDIEPVLSKIAQARRVTGATRLTCVGNSMGGFGALLVGALAGADAILAISPQILVGPLAVELLGDRSYEEEQRHLNDIPFPDVSAIPQPAGRVTVVCSAGHNIDLSHVAHLTRAWPAATVLTVDTVQHGAVYALKDAGRLDAVIAGALL